MYFYNFLLLTLFFNCYSGVPHASKHEDIIFIFAHGIFDTAQQSEQYGNIVPDDVMISFDFEDAMHIPFVYRPFYSSLGQEDEIEKLNKTYEWISSIF